MSLVKTTVEQYKNYAGENFSQKALDNWLRIREIEIDTLGEIHPETGTFFTDDYGLSIDWDQGWSGIECKPDGTLEAVAESAFGHTSFALTTGAEIQAFIQVYVKDKS